jgi:hypothetical protein
VPRQGFHNRSLLLAFGVYFFVCIAATFIGNFPVPVLGYGLSPTLGYVSALFSIAYTKSWQPSLKIVEVREASPP